MKQPARLPYRLQLVEVAILQPEGHQLCTNEAGGSAKWP